MQAPAHWWPRWKEVTVFITELIKVIERLTKDLEEARAERDAWKLLAREWETSSTHWYNAYKREERCNDQ